jgi:hypothetical protein
MRMSGVVGGGEEGLPAGFAHFEAVAVGEEDPAFVASFAEDFADAGNVDDCGAVHADEFAGVEGVGELLDGFAEHELSCADVEAGVVVGCFDPFDVVHVDEGVFGAVGDDEAPGIFGTFGFGGVEGGQDGLELFVRDERGLRGELLADSLKRGVESLGLDGLGEVVERVDGEGFDGVMVVRGDEDGDGHVRGADFVDDVEGGAPGHLDVEEEDVVTIGFEVFDDFAAIAAFAGDCDVFVAREEEAQPLTGEWLVVGDEDFQLHQVRS